VLIILNLPLPLAHSAKIRNHQSYSDDTADLVNNNK